MQQSWQRGRPHAHPTMFRTLGTTVPFPLPPRLIIGCIRVPLVFKKLKSTEEKPPKFILSQMGLQKINDLSCFKKYALQITRRPLQKYGWYLMGYLGLWGVIICLKDQQIKLVYHAYQIKIERNAARITSLEILENDHLYSEIVIIFTIMLNKATDSIIAVWNT